MPEKIIYITPIAPYPVTGGEKIRSLGLLECLSELGHEVQAITPAMKETVELKELLPDTTFHFYDFNRENNSLFSQFSGYFRKDPELSERIRGIIRDFRPVLAVIDYFFLGQYMDLFSRQGIPVIYGTHNAQARLRLDQPASAFKEKIIRRFAHLAQALHERLYFDRADALLVVSEPDRSYHAKFVDAGKIIIVSNFLDERKYTPSGIKEDYIVMSGNFDSFQNSYGIEWFVKEAWEESLKSRSRLVLAGNGSVELARSHGWTVEKDNIAAMGYVEDMRAVIAKARAAIVPLLHGGGTRFKILEAMALETQVVSTAKGAEGIDHMGSVLVADSPSGFRDAILEVLEGKADTTARAKEIFLEKYSMRSVLARLNGLITDLVKKGEDR
jgi:glycosyltransferase involved in cell wall biosynthesis